MARVLPVLLFLALAGAPFLIPPADPVRRAALDAWPAHGSGDFESYLPLAEAVLGGPALREEGGRRVLRLGGVRFASDQPTADLTVHSLARDSIARGLREAATDRGEVLVIEGELMPVKGGADFLVEHRGSNLSVSYAHPENGALVRAVHAAPTRRSISGRSPWLVLPALGSALIALAFLFRRSRGGGRSPHAGLPNR